MSMAPGTEFAGDYHIVEQIGHNSLGVVYKAHQPSLARYVAIKILPRSVTRTESYTEQFLQQGAKLERLRHVALLELYTCGVEQGMAYLVTELIEHQTLDMQMGNPLSVGFLERILGPIASVLDYAHEEGVIHRNIKPANVLLSRDGRPFLQDLGLASLVEGSSERAAKQTTFGLPVGTPAYMAPEYAAGDPLGPAADRYSLAVVAYELLIGRVPFTGDTPMAVMLNHLRQTPPRPSTLNPAISSAMDEVLLKALAKDPGQRYDTASAFIAELCGSARTAAAAVYVQIPSAQPPPLRSAEGMGAQPAMQSATIQEVPLRRQARTTARSDVGSVARLKWMGAKGAGTIYDHLFRPLLQLTAGLRTRLAWMAYRLGKKTGLSPALLVGAATVVVVGGIVLVVRL